MANYKIERATKYADGSMTATLLFEEGIACNHCNVVVSDGSGSFGEAGAISVLPPVNRYTKKDGSTGVDRVVVFANRENANKLVTEKVASNDSEFFRFETPTKIKGGEIIGSITIEVPLHLNVRVSKDNVLFMPSRKSERDGKAVYYAYVWPFVGKGEELAAEKESLIELIKANAVDYVPKTEATGQ